MVWAVCGQPAGPWSACWTAGQLVVASYMQGDIKLVLHLERATDIDRR